MNKIAVPQEMAAVRLRGVSRNYRLGKMEVPAVRHVDLDVRKADFLVIAGPSGSGKTTMLNMMGLIDKPTTGKVHLSAIDTTSLNLEKLVRLRRERIGFIFQTFNLVPVWSVYENVEYPLILNRVSAKQRAERVKAILDRVGLAERSRHRPRELSGGERQRTAVARAVVKKPEIVLADEPTANLDSRIGAGILDLMRRLHDREGITFVFSSHDPRIIDMADRVVHMSDGRIEEEVEWRRTS